MKSVATEKLGDLFKTAAGGTPNTKRRDYYDGGNVPWLMSGEVRQGEICFAKNYITAAGLENSSARIFPRNTVLIALYGATAGQVGILRIEAATNQAVFGILPNAKFVPEFIFYLLLSKYEDLFSQAIGNAQPNLSGLKIKNVDVPIVPLPEQRRIVAILDEAFAAIATAKANTEHNLANARALFESHLQAVFTQRGEGWMDTTIGEQIHFIDYRGKTPVKTDSGMRLITAKNVKMGYVQENPMEFVSPASYDAWMTRGIPKHGDVLFTTEAPLANVAQLDTHEKVVFAQRIIIMQPDRSKLDPTFLKYLLLSQSVQHRIRTKGTGATVQGIKASLLRTIEISFPNSLAVQRTLTATLDALSTETQRLESLAQRKLSALDAFKASLLHHAFTGQLAVQRAVHAATRQTVFKISMYDLHAGVLALAYDMHAKAGCAEKFGHVKAEKTAHMIEAHLGIDLGRVPVKDAAGPNDFPHLKKVEFRASKARYFDFQAVDGEYQIIKLDKFESLIHTLRKTMPHRIDEIEELLRLMLPMDTRKAEIFATVYAAWNNLLLDGLASDDEAIVTEARENWHPEKLKIDRKRFFDAIAWMKSKGTVPKGTGKKVLAKASV